jgi:hypothetical protein
MQDELMLFDEMSRHCSGCSREERNESHACCWLIYGCLTAAASDAAMLAVVLTAASVSLCVVLTGLSLIRRCYFFVHSCHASAPYKPMLLHALLQR